MPGGTAFPRLHHIFADGGYAGPKLQDASMLAPTWIRSYLLMSWSGPRSAQPEQSLRRLMEPEEENGAEGPVFSWYGEWIRTAARRLG